MVLARSFSRSSTSSTRTARSVSHRDRRLVAGSTGPILFSDLLMGESYDARRRCPAGPSPASTTPAGTPVVTEDADATPGGPARTRPIRVTRRAGSEDRHRAARAGVTSSTSARTWSGWVRLRVAGDGRDEVTLRFAEMLEPRRHALHRRTCAAPGAPTPTSLDGERRGGATSRASPSTASATSRSPAIRASRRPAAITGAVVGTPTTPPVGTFECSDPMVNQLQRQHRLGPARQLPERPDRLPAARRAPRLDWATRRSSSAPPPSTWTSPPSSRSGCTTSTTRSPPTAPSRRGAAAERSDSCLRWGAPAWGDAGVIVPWTIYRTYGDTADPRASTATRWPLDGPTCSEANPDLLCEHTIAATTTATGCSIESRHARRSCSATAYWAYDAKLMAEMAAATGRDEDAMKYRRPSNERIKAAFERGLRLARRPRLRATRRPLLPRPALRICCQKQLRHAAAEHLVADYREPKAGTSRPASSASRYLLPGADRGRHRDVAYRLLEQRPSRRGATSITQRRHHDLGALGRLDRREGLPGSPE